MTNQTNLVGLILSLESASLIGLDTDGNESRPYLGSRTSIHSQALTELFQLAEIDDLTRAYIDVCYAAAKALTQASFPTEALIQDLMPKESAVVLAAIANEPLPKFDTPKETAQIYSGAAHILTSSYAAVELIKSGSKEEGDNEPKGPNRQAIQTIYNIIQQQT